MSILFGCMKEPEAQISVDEIVHLGTFTKMYAAGETLVSRTGRVGMGFQPFATPNSSQPVYDSDGHMLTFDGRLDNRRELANELRLCPTSVSDARILLQSFLRWGDACFSRLVGDWAVVLWCDGDQMLYLARDHAGTRTLYFSHEGSTVTWSTHPDALMAGIPGRRMSNDYAARYLTSQPFGNLSPYAGILAVRPGHYVRFQNRQMVERVHWEMSKRRTLRYKSDSEYEQHFLSLLTQAVVRRTGPELPIIAELSGGMDSSSIVCLSDHARRRSDACAELLDTVSYFDESEPSLNDSQYYALIEAYRGKTGIHINTAIAQRTFEPLPDVGAIYPVPGADASFLDRERLFQRALWGKGYRCVLSGVGGDEFLGGVPDPLPELSDYFVTANMLTLLARAFQWCLAERTTLLGTLLDTVKHTAKLYGPPSLRRRLTAPWLTAHLRESDEEGFWYQRLAKVPTELDNEHGWAVVTGSLPHLFPLRLFRPEYRYPLLDKDVIEFLFSIPREQLLRPGRRRSLMRRALVGIVPTEILERRRKAFQLSAPLKAVAAAQQTIRELFTDSLLAREGMIDPQQLLLWLDRTSSGDPTWRQALIKTICLELWLRAFRVRSK